MTLPGNVDMEWVTGSYENLDGSIPTGTVTFTPQVAANTPLVDAAALKILLPSTFTATLDGAGSFTIKLPATNDTDVQPVGWTYKVTESLSGFSRSYSISLAIGEGPVGTPVNLATKAPTLPVTAGVVMVKSVNGVLPDSTGNITISGGGGGWTPPTGGIPITDMDSTVQADLAKGASSVQSVNGVTPDGSGAVALTSAGTVQVWKVEDGSHSFTPVGSTSHYLIVGKGVVGDDASVLFRDGGVIMAEVGTAADDDLHFKVVTTGGTSFIDGIIVKNAAPNTGKVYIPVGLGVGTVPVEKLHVADAEATGTRVVAKIENTSGAGAAVEVKGVGSDWILGSDVGGNGGDNLGLFHNGAYPPVWMVGANNRLLVGVDSPNVASQPSSIEALGSLATRGVNSLGPLNWCGKSSSAGAPTAGSWNAADAIVDSLGILWVCTAGGSPGTWVGGARGVKVFFGTGTPSGSLAGAIAGDVYIDQATGDCYTAS